jgi:hypothetical protein
MRGTPHQGMQAGNGQQCPLCLVPSVDLVCIAIDCAKKTSIPAIRELLAPSLSPSSDCMIGVLLAQHRS